MYIKKDYDFYDLLDNSWSGAVATLEKIQEKHKEIALMMLLDEVFQYIPDETDVNDFLWFEDDFIFESLDITEDEDDDEGEEF